MSCGIGILHHLMSWTIEQPTFTLWIGCPYNIPIFYQIAHVWQKWTANANATYHSNGDVTIATAWMWATWRLLLSRRSCNISNVCRTTTAGWPACFAIWVTHRRTLDSHSRHVARLVRKNVRTAWKTEFARAHHETADEYAIRSDTDKEWVELVQHWR